MPSPLDHNASQQLLIALGDPAGIGMEVTLKALASSRLPASLQPVLVGCRRSLMATHARLLQQGITAVADPDQLIIDDQPLEVPVQPGKPTTAGAAAGFRWLTRAVECVQQGHGRALVTAPIAKHLWHAAGHHYPGQTERLAELAGSAQSSMLFTAVAPHGTWRLNTLLTTTHLPFSQITAALTPELVEHKLNVLLNFCQRFRPDPHLVVAGLNPHAGEGSHLGHEDLTIIAPVCDALRERGLAITGPVPADSAFIPSIRSKTDAYLAMYHDQGLPVLKALGFHGAVNVTLGLPIVRTSVDHGTALDLAGTGRAEAGSLKAAIQVALDLV